MKQVNDTKKSVKKNKKVSTVQEKQDVAKQNLEAAMAAYTKYAKRTA